MFYSDFQDLITTVNHYAPELLFATRDLVAAF